MYVGGQNLHIRYVSVADWDSCCGLLLTVTLTRWDKGAMDVTRYAELQAVVAENQGRLTDIKKGMEAGGGWWALV
jgi:hypothetical protein